MQKIIGFVKKEAVLCVAFIAALASSFFVPPDAGYIEYIDFRVLVLLFCLMAVVAGIQKCGVFSSLARTLCSGEKTLKRIIFILVLLPFFTSMLITNDVALITFVPFAILVLNSIGKNDKLIFTIVMQTIAANLGSMATPVGNPQNLYLCNKFFSNLGDFFKIVFPVTAVSLILICLVLIFVKKEKVVFSADESVEALNKKKIAIWTVLFVLCLLSVFKILNEWVLFTLVFIVVLLTDRKVLKSVDYSLLVTFVFFFIFAGNIARIDAVSNFLNRIMLEQAELCTLLVSQVISNVPAAVMLSNFTDNGKVLLQYTNIGGLGTIVVSLASLISFKFYVKVKDAKPIKYLVVFSAFNILFLAVLCLIVR